MKPRNHRSQPKPSMPPRDRDIGRRAKLSACHTPPNRQNSAAFGPNFNSRDLAAPSRPGHSHRSLLGPFYAADRTGGERG